MGIVLPFPLASRVTLACIFVRSLPALRYCAILCSIDFPPHGLVLELLWTGGSWEGGSLRGLADATCLSPSRVEGVEGRRLAPPFCFDAAVDDNDGACLLGDVVSAGKRPPFSTVIPLYLIRFVSPASCWLAGCARLFGRHGFAWVLLSYSTWKVCRPKV